MLMEYEVIIDNINKYEWEQFASRFADYSIYQTWPYQQVRGEANGQEVSRIVINDRHGQVITMCYVRIKHIRPLGLKIGYVQWGPLIRRKDDTVKCSVEILKTLREAYVGQRVNVLRLVPNVRNKGVGQELVGMFEQSGFQRVHNVAPYHTTLIPIHYSEEILRSRLHQSWRRKLKKAEGTDIEIRECTDEDSFAILEKFYLEMMRRKGLKGLTPQEFTRTQALLSDAEKMNMIVAYYDNQPISAHLTANFGDTAILLLTAGNEKGYQMKASYLVWWKAILTSKRLGMKIYDTGGIDFQKVPTVSHFKAGLGGEECSYIGAFEVCTNMMVKNIWRMVERTYKLVKK